MQTADGAIRNYINNSTSFEDASSTAMIAAVTFRLAVLKNNFATYIANAEAAYNYVSSNIDSDGWLRHTVDPEAFSNLSTTDNPSPEGQSFVLLMESARRDFQDLQVNSVSRKGVPTFLFSCLVVAYSTLFLFDLGR